MAARKPRPIATLKVPSIADRKIFWRVRLYRDLNALATVMGARKVLAGFISDCNESRADLGTFVFALGYAAPNIVAHELFHSLTREVLAIAKTGLPLSFVAEEQLIMDYENLFKVINAWLVDPTKKGI